MRTKDRPYFNWFVVVHDLTNIEIESSRIHHKNNDEQCEQYINDFKEIGLFRLFVDVITAELETVNEEYHNMILETTNWLFDCWLQIRRPEEAYSQYIHDIPGPFALPTAQHDC